MGDLLYCDSRLHTCYCQLHTCLCRLQNYWFMQTWSFD